MQQQASQGKAPAKPAKTTKKPAAAAAAAGAGPLAQLQEQGLEAAAAKPKVKRKRAAADAKENCEAGAAQAAGGAGKKPKEYVPGYMTANFAFVIVLYRVSPSGGWQLPVTCFAVDQQQQNEIAPGYHAATFIDQASMGVVVAGDEGCLVLCLFVIYAPLIRWLLVLNPSP